MLFRSQQSAAQQDYLKAKTAQTAEEKKVYEAQAARAAQVQSVVALVDQIIDDESGVFVTNQDDINRMKARFKTEIVEKYGNNPAAIKAALDRFNSKLGSGATTEWFGSTDAAKSEEGRI